MTLNHSGDTLRVEETRRTASQEARAPKLSTQRLSFSFSFLSPQLQTRLPLHQASWLVGMFLWLVRFAFRPRPRLYKTPVDYLLLGFFILSGLSAFLSYEPMVSIGKLRAASLFTIIYLFVENVPSLRVVRLLALTLISACTVNVVYTAGQRLLGLGVKVYGVSVNSVLYQANIRDGGYAPCRRWAEAARTARN